MNADSGSFYSPELGTSLRPKGLHLADSGAGIHAINDPKYIVPGSLRANTTAVSTANGVTVPPHRCDAALSVRTREGRICRLELRDAVLLPDCQHSLVSLGLLARDLHASTTIGAGTDDSFICMADGERISLINSGVLKKGFMNLFRGKRHGERRLASAAARLPQEGRPPSADRSIEFRSTLLTRLDSPALVARATRRGRLSARQW